MLKRMGIVKKTNARIVVEIQRREEDKWKSLGRMAIYRSPEGELSQLPESPRS
jgi:hypothetical protein